MQMIEDNDIDITILVTCFNEENTIIDTLETTISALNEVKLSYEIIVIDDKSSDNSVALIKEFIDLNSKLPIRLFVNEINQGLANNYVDGSFLGKGKYYRLQCGDNAISKEDLVEIFKYTGKADIIISYQVQKEVKGKPKSRKIISGIFTKIVNILSGYNIKYYNGLSTHLRYNVMRWHPISYGFGFQADILTILLEQGSTYVQVRVYNAEDKKGGTSTALSMRNFLSVVHTLIEIAIRRIRRFLYGKHWPKPRELTLEK